MSWPGGRVSPSGIMQDGEPRKVRTPQSRVVANGHLGRPTGQCHRKQTAIPVGLVPVRSTRARPDGKGETVR